VRLKKENRNFFQIFLFFFSALLIIFLVISNLKIEKRRKELKREIENLNSTLQTLKEKNEDLKKAILKAKSENYWEEKAREEGYVKEGEEAIVIKKIEEEKGSQKEGIWQRIIKIFQK
jgi:cell division protein FtsB